MQRAKTRDKIGTSLLGSVLFFGDGYAKNREVGHAKFWVHGQRWPSLLGSPLKTAWSQAHLLNTPPMIWPSLHELPVLKKMTHSLSVGRGKCNLQP